jgi:Uncharacterized protein conserved in bacteria
MIFQGEFHNAIDVKGRASIPARLRDVLVAAYGEERLVVTQKDGGLVAYPLPEWDKIVAQVNAMRPGPVKEDINLTLISPAQECLFDKQGRIQLSKAQRSYAGLDGEGRDIVVVGSFNKIMLWEWTRHADMRRQAEARLKADPQVLYDLGF